MSFLLEPSPTLSTFERSLACVRPQMDLQVRFSLFGELFPTAGAWENFFYIKVVILGPEGSGGHQHGLRVGVEVGTKGSFGTQHSTFHTTWFR